MNVVNILSIATYLPGEPISNQVLEQKIGTLDEELMDQVGVNERYWTTDPDTGKIRESNSEMSAKSAKAAIEKAGLNAEDIDLIVMSTCSPDYPLPATVTQVQDLLGLRRVATLEVRSGCCGAIQALDIAKLYLSSGQYRTALVIGTEVISPVLYQMYGNKEQDLIRLRDKLCIYSFGDGSAAMVLQASETTKGHFIGSSTLACVGGGKKPGMMVPLGGTAIPLTHEALDKGLFSLKVDFSGSAKYTAEILNEGFTDTLQKSGLTAQEIQSCIIPEGNTDYLRDDLERSGCLTEEWLEIEKRVYDNLNYVGNTGSPAVMLAFEHAVREGKVKQGDNVMFLAIETSKWLFAGTVFQWKGV
ncbi:3-oxoacyl-ACP synthase III family protein [Paenibacillus endoradicis]|uniref:3-oxoacyl-ACP synthase III family protein n=1 Tax=Paenibacillus endoradicis TaxID=2972487 RepID=UPI0021591DBC|nr:ketoacyl-ACP synthase III [Paenibacillus endoradicis]MCR8657736.1 ketoacyl-ACP synthase III [Paenibacillus endoradicis]